MKKKRVSSAGGGGYCCDRCSDSKFPCVFMEKQLRGGIAAGHSQA